MARKATKKKVHGTFTDEDGNTYIGELKDGTPHGRGTYAFTTGAKYTGELKMDTLHGQGTLFYADGSKYAGEWSNNNIHGQGSYEYSDGSKYIGQWRDNKKNGQGTWTFDNGDKYDGEFKNNLEHGQGTFTSANGYKYVGEFKDGYRHGQGTETFDNLSKFAGYKYVGEFKDGHYNGQGIYSASNGSIREGTWVEGTLRSGKFKFSGRIASFVEIHLLKKGITDGELNCARKNNYLGNDVFGEELKTIYLFREKQDEEPLAVAFVNPEGTTKWISEEYIPGEHDPERYRDWQVERFFDLESDDLDILFSMALYPGQLENGDLLNSNYLIESTGEMGEIKFSEKLYSDLEMAKDSCLMCQSLYADCKVEIQFDGVVKDYQPASTSVASPNIEEERKYFEFSDYLAKFETMRIYCNPDAGR